jgi:hypothetical protein
MGGTDDPSNLVELTVEEHAEAHRLLWEEHGNVYDYIAWKGLSGDKTTSEIRSEATKEGMKRWWDSLTEEEKEDYKKRCSIRPDGYVPHSGHTYSHTQNAKDAISEFQKNRERSAEEKAKLAQNRKGKGTGERNSMSKEENRRKVANSKIGLKRSYLPDGSFKMVRMG